MVFDLKMVTYHYVNIIKYSAARFKKLILKKIKPSVYHRPTWEPGASFDKIK